MALVACPECTKQISTLAAACPHCGYPMQGKIVAQIKLPSLQLRNCMDCSGSGKQKEDCPCCGGNRFRSMQHLYWGWTRL